MAGPNDPNEKDPLGSVLESFFGKYFDKFMKELETNISTERISKVLDDVDTAASRILNTFGTGRDRIVDLKASMSDAVASVIQLGGEFSNIENIQKEVASTLKRNVIPNKDVYDDIYAITKVTGQDAGTLVSNFKDVGVSLYQMTDRVNEALAVSQKLGVNASAVIGSMMNNMEALNKFNFEGGTEGLARMAAHATSLRFNMKETLNLADKVFNPEGAIQVAAAMQRLGVAQSDLLDPLRLMDLAQNDPEELQKQLEGLSKSFVKMKADGSFEILPGEKRRLMEIENQLGMTQGSLAKLALSSAEVGEKMKKIKFGGDFTEDEQRFIASITEIGKGGAMTIQLGGKELGINEALAEFRKDDKKLAELMKPKDAIELAKQQLSTLDSIDANMKTVADRSAYAAAGTRAVNEVEDAQRRISGIIPGLGEAPGLRTQDIRTGLFGAVENAIDRKVAGVSNEKIFEGLEKDLKEYGKKFNEFMPHAIKVIEGTNLTSNRFIKLGGEILDLTDQLKKAEFVNLKNELLKYFEDQKTKPAEQKSSVNETPESTKKNMEGSGGGNGGLTQSATFKIEFKHDINVDGSTNLNQAEITAAVKESLEKAEVADKVIQAVNKVMTDNNRTEAKDILKAYQPPLGRSGKV